MLFGTNDPGDLAAQAPAIESFGAEPVTLMGVETLQILCEVPFEAAQARLPPALHPTQPALVGWVVQSVAESPWGPFRLAQMRLECRSGVRPRALLLHSVCDSLPAAYALSSGWGFSFDVRPVSLRRYYDSIQVEVGEPDDPILAIGMREPEPLGADTLQAIAGLHPVQTDRGLRLLQCDPEARIDRAERGSVVIELFDDEAWQAEGLVPELAVSAAFTVGEVTLPKLRFLLRADVWAFEGTESI